MRKELKNLLSPDLKEYYTLHGILLTVIFQDQAAYRSVSAILKELSFLNQRKKKTALPWRSLTLTVKTGKQRIPASFKTVMRSCRSKTRAMRRGNELIFTDGNCVFTVSSPEKKGRLHPGKESTTYLRRFALKQVIISGLMGLLRGSGLYPLHACGVTRGRHKLLILGNSGSGKSTVTLSLILSGWNFLSDDLLLLQEKKQGTLALCAETYLTFNPDLFERAGYAVNGTGLFTPLAGKEKIIDLGCAYPRQSIGSFYPNNIVFLDITKNKKSRITPITGRLALFKLINQSVTIMLGDSFAQKNLDALNRLTKQSACFQLSLGRDLSLNPLEIKNLLSKFL